MLLRMKMLMMVLMFMLILDNSPVVIVAFAPVLTVDVTAAAVAAISFFYHQSIKICQATKMLITHGSAHADSMTSKELRHKYCRRELANS